MSVLLELAAARRRSPRAAAQATGNDRPEAPRRAGQGRRSSSGRCAAPARRCRRDRCAARRRGTRRPAPARRRDTAAPLMRITNGSRLTREQDQRVEQHLQARVLLAVRHRQHRHAGARVVLGAVQRERPEVRRRPGEDDEEQQQRLDGDLAGHRRPAEHRRHRARGAADDDVLRRRRLEDHRVDHRVADERGERQPHGERVDELHQQPQAGAAQQRRRTPGSAAPRARRAAAAASCVRAITASIFCSTRQLTAAAAPATRRCRRWPASSVPQRHHAGRGEEHADHRGEHDERHHARLGQREEGAQALGEARGENLCSHREGRKPRKAKKFSTTSAASSAAAPALWAAASASGRLNATLAIAERELQQQQRADE